MGILPSFQPQVPTYQSVGPKMKRVSVLGRTKGIVQKEAAWNYGPITLTGQRFAMWGRLVRLATAYWTLCMQDLGGLVLMGMEKYPSAWDTITSTMHEPARGV